MTPPAPTTAGLPPRRSVVARRRTAIGLLVAVAIAVLLTIIVATGSHAPDSFDQTLTDFTRGWADPLGWPVDAAHVIGKVTAPFWSALAATGLVLVLFVSRHRAAAGLIALSGIAGVTVSETVKAAMGRQRPPGAEQFEQDLDKSFPSGHSMEGIYLYIAAGLVLLHLGRAHDLKWMRVLGRVLVVIGPFIGVSRLVLGVHWPTDIIAGWAFGSVVLLAAALILWWPLDRGWAAPAPSDAPSGPAPPGSAPTPDPPAG